MTRKKRKELRKRPKVRKSDTLRDVNMKKKMKNMGFNEREGKGVHSEDEKVTLGETDFFLQWKQLINSGKSHVHQIY